jgi:integrase
MFCTYKLVHNRRGKKGLAPLEIEIKYPDHSRYWLSTGIKLLDTQWNGEIIATTEELASTAFILTEHMQKIKTFEMDCRRKGITFTHDLLKRFLNQENFNATFNEYFRIKSDELYSNKKIEKSTHYSMIQTVNLITKFKEVLWGDIKNGFVDEFDGWMCKRGLSHNTIAKHHKNIKRIVNIAIKDPIVDLKREDYPYDRDNNKSFKRTKFDSLNFEELERIGKLELEGVENTVRNMFLLSCYTGLRYSDVVRVKDNYRKNQHYAIHLEQQKVGYDVYLPLEALFSGVGEGYFIKYMEEGFPVIDNVEANQHLQSIAQKASLNRKITYHISRHTFLTNLSFETGNIFKVMMYSGIREVKTAQNYIHYAQRLYGD